MALKKGAFSTAIVYLRINLYVIWAIMLLLSSNLIFVMNLNNIYGQTTSSALSSASAAAVVERGYTKNNTNNNADSINTSILDNTSIITSLNQTQEAKMNPCLNMMNPGMMTEYAYNSVNGSIKLGTNLNSSLSEIKISLSQAATMAEKEIGNNSHAIEAYLCSANGYLVYLIWLRNPHTGNTTDVLVDPANGKTLLKNSNLFPPITSSQQQSFAMDMMPGMNGMNH